MTGVQTCALPISVSGELCRVAEIFLSATAVFAGAIGLVQPGDAHRRSNSKPLGTGPEFLDDANHLIPGNYRRHLRWKFSFDHMQVRPTDSAHLHTHENFAIAGETMAMRAARESAKSRQGSLRHPPSGRLRHRPTL